jgi:hypothetical protein
MTREDRILEKIWEIKIKDWDKKYGKLTEALAMQYGYNGATEIMINANGQPIDTVIKDRLMPYKFKDESEDCYRISVEHLTIEVLENIYLELS